MGINTYPQADLLCMPSAETKMQAETSTGHAHPILNEFSVREKISDEEMRELIMKVNHSIEVGTSNIDQTNLGAGGRPRVTLRPVPNDGRGRHAEHGAKRLQRWGWCEE